MTKKQNAKKCMCRRLLYRHLKNYYLENNCVYTRKYTNGLKETPHQKRCITCYMNIIHVRLCGVPLIESHLITYWTFGSVFKIFQNWGGSTILKDAPCAHGTNVFATKFRKSPWKLFYKQEIIKISKRNKKWKASRRNNDNDVGTFGMLKYGRNEKLKFCIYIGHEGQKLFWGIIIFIRKSPSIKFCRCDFLTIFLTKGLFLTSTTQTLPTFNGGFCSVDVFSYIRSQASSRISMRNRCAYDETSPLRTSVLLRKHKWATMDRRYVPL